MQEGGRRPGRHRGAEDGDQDGGAEYRAKLPGHLQDGASVTYGRLGAWVVDQAMTVNGPVHETYLVSPRDTAEPAEWRTEIGWPIFRVAPN